MKKEGVSDERSRRLHIIFGSLFRTVGGIDTPDLYAARIIVKGTVENGIVENPNLTGSAIRKTKKD